MVMPIVLASGSSVRAQLLRNAGIEFTIEKPRVDEDTLKQAMIAELAAPRDIADALADMKARKISRKFPGSWVIGCDQTLDFKGKILSKPESKVDAVGQLSLLRARSHTLYSAAVIYQNGEPVWRHIGKVTMHMAMLSDDYINGYTNRNWEDIRHSTGAYLLEHEGIRLFERIDGDYFTVLGMPLLEILNYLTLRGVIAR